jgi:tRNASer (uridine44-2'-O)-methyltransferase
MRAKTDNQPLFLTSCLDENARRWQTAAEYEQGGLAISPEGFASATNILLTQPNLNSSHLFRADILYDSTKQLKTPAELERERCISTETKESDDVVIGRTPGIFPGFTVARTVVRKLMPRNVQLDDTLIQSCHLYEGGASRHLVVYRSHADSADATPWYHPPVAALAYLYRIDSPKEHGAPDASISIHVLPFEVSSPSDYIPTRLHRTLLSLLQTLTRLAKSMSRPVGDTFNAAIAPKDNIIPQHIVQNTYSRLKQTYSTELISRWVEKTEPSKHVFEDISIAAFLIELWRQMYGVLPACERSTSIASINFPGFVDIACGNGVLVYLLRNEGYEGWGFDARKRRTWEVLLGDIQEHLREQMLVPNPFLKAMAPTAGEEFSNTGCQEKGERSLTELPYHSGIFKAGTFIISNHADELTPWTPILAAISSPTDPLPWLTIPCCSHALSGAIYRYPVSKGTSRPRNHMLIANLASHSDSRPSDTTKDNNPEPNSSLIDGKQGQSLPENPISSTEGEKQPTHGDLKALRAAKTKAASGADRSSMYACLTAKVADLAEELGIETERTLMRIPSTRNIGIIGGRRRAVQKSLSQPPIRNEEEEESQVGDLQQNGLVVVELKGDEALASRLEDAPGMGHMQQEGQAAVQSEQNVLRKVEALIERECRASGGVAAAAQIWMDRAKSLQTGQGRGKLNAGKGHG